VAGGWFRQSAGAAPPVSARKRKVLNSDNDVDEAGVSPCSIEASGDSPQASDSAVKKSKSKRHGLIISYNPNQRGSLHEGTEPQLVLSKAVPLNDGALPLFKAKLSCGHHSLL